MPEDDGCWFRRVFDLVNHRSYMGSPILKASQNVPLILNPWMATDALDYKGLVGMVPRPSKPNVPMQQQSEAIRGCKLCELHNVLNLLGDNIRPNSTAEYPSEAKN